MYIISYDTNHANIMLLRHFFHIKRHAAKLLISHSNLVIALFGVFIHQRQ